MPTIFIASYNLMAMNCKVCGR